MNILMLALIVVFLNVVDLSLSLRLLQLNGIELNPIMAFLLNYPPSAIAVKMGGCILFMAIVFSVNRAISNMHKYDEKTTRELKRAKHYCSKMLLTLIFIYAAIDAWSIFLLQV